MNRSDRFRVFLLLMLFVDSSSNEQQQQQAAAPVCSSCQVYFAPSPWDPDQWTMYSGVAITAGSTVASQDLFLSITDANPNEYSPWHDLAWDPLSPSNILYPDALWENNYLHQLLLGGIGALTECGGTAYANIELRALLNTSSRHFVQAHALRDIRPGEVLLTPCRPTNSDLLHYFKRHPETTTTFEALARHQGICMDVLSIQPSPHGGHGAFAQTQVVQGQVLLHTPVLPLDRSQLNVVQQQERSLIANNKLPQFARSHGIQFNNTKVTRQQLWTSYVCGRHDSNVLLWPMAPGVNFIQHSSDEAPNVKLQWSQRYGHVDYLLNEYSPMELLELAFGEDGYLMIEFVALHDIQPGDEIRLDYGSDWQTAWSQYQQQQQQRQQQEQDNKITAHEYMQQHSWEPTMELPLHLQTACHFVYTPSSEEPPSADITWQTPTLSYCWRPCEIVKRTDDGLYTAVVHSMESILEPVACGVLPASVRVTQIPRQAIRLMNRPYTLPEYSSNSFRHEIGVPQDNFYPRHWLLPDPQPYGDFIASPLSPGMMAPIRWKSTAQVVSPWAFRVGVPASVRQVLLEYCDAMGIMDVFRHVTIHGNALQADENGYLPLGDNTTWYLQRPGPEWRSNLHWLSPGDEHSHEHYLQALSAAGFDTVLDGVGQYLGMEGLVAFHVTFIAVSQSTVGYQHHDILSTGAKTYNVIVPLLLANHTGPELDLVEGASYDDGFNDQETRIVGRYRYEYEVASMMGDGAVHATSAVDYRRHHEMRLAATIYIADVNEKNADSILKEYTQAYPPDDRELLLSWAGRHWKKTDPTVRLPRPSDDHILMQKKE